MAPCKDFSNDNSLASSVALTNLVPNSAADHAEYLSENATLAFAAAIWRWMTPMKVKQPSAHQVMVGKWVPTKNDTEALRLPGFGMTINILKADAECGTDSDDKQMNTRIAHYLDFLDHMDVGRENAGDNVDCSEQKVLNPFLLRLHLARIPFLQINEDKFVMRLCGIFSYISPDCYMYSDIFAVQVHTDCNISTMKLFFPGWCLFSDQKSDIAQQG
uniref:LP6 n=1 Tax=Pinus taeda TaxID=3352 RepID=Q41083_PINTA|nr:LP6 [Pinus taeda]